MKAAVYTSYGPPHVIKITDVAQPVPKEDEVLIAVRAASVNPLDGLTAGKPYSLRIMTGLRRPKATRLGVDVAGVVAAAGRTVTQSGRSARTGSSTTRRRISPRVAGVTTSSSTASGTIPCQPAGAF
jgi:NADPH:quinone reductase-like Zn-dependent oxidoreductase